ncbi:MAG: hypothetical protein IJV84_07380 [Bacteroidales bacterium]|nr:hypothetical protein [Bacteroidales bacterium]MBQ9723324.1 hypothetical protein [Bacteroidales bacterium]
MKTIIKDKAMMMEEVRTLISEGHTVSFTVKGNSMNPFMVHLRDKITLGPWKEADLKEGVVVLVRDTRGNHLIHRIISKGDATVTLLGDGNIAQTETATLDDVIGIMYSFERKGRIWKPSDFGWRAYSLIWKFLTPVRRWPLGLWRKLNRSLLYRP